MGACWLLCLGQFNAGSVLLYSGKSVVWPDCGICKQCFQFDLSGAAFHGSLRSNEEM